MIEIILPVTTRLFYKQTFGSGLQENTQFGKDKLSFTVVSPKLHHDTGQKN